MRDSDALALETILVLYGTVLSLFGGAVVVDSGAAVASPPTVVGAAAPILIAGVVKLAGNRTARAAERVAAMTDTRRGRALLGVGLLVVLIVRYLVQTAPQSVRTRVLLGLFGAGLALVVLGLGHAGHRLLRA